MTKITYTAFNANDSSQFESGLSLREAADRCLSHDSQEWEVRPDADGGFFVWTRKQVANIKWTKCRRLYSLADTLDAATDEICEKVIYAARGRNDAIEVMADESFAQMQAEIEADAK